VSAALTVFETSGAPIYARRSQEMLAGLSAGYGVPSPPGPPNADAGSQLCVRSLGVLEVWRGDDRSDIGGPKVRELLAALLAARSPVHRDRLRGWLWPAETPSAADEALRAAAESLAESIGPDRLRIADRGLRLTLQPGDTWDIGELLQVDPEATVDGLTSALVRWSAPPFSEWPDAEWAVAIRRECENALRRLRGQLAESLLASDRIEDALPHFAQLVDLDPLAEGWHRGLMRCHAELGDIPLALRQYHACRSILRQNRATDPSPETQALYHELLARGRG
jgi:DNA-binding SARP family transcriptional activator